MLPQVREVIHRVGYPVYFLVILGGWKLLGSIAIIIPRFPRLKEWAYAGVIFNLTGALASNLVSGVHDSTDELPLMQRQNRAYPSENSMVVVHSRTPVRITEHLQTPSYAASH